MSNPDKFPPDPVTLIKNDYDSGEACPSCKILSYLTIAFILGCWIIGFLIS